MTVPTESGGLRASDADRDKVAEVLHAAFADGRIDMDEHNDRVAAALSAKTFNDLTPLTADLMAGSATEIVRRTETASMIVPDGAVDATDQISAALSDHKRVGKWRVRRHTNANNLMATVHFDLTEATFDAPEVEISGVTVMGTLFLRVPRGVTIRDETTNVMGSTSIKDIGEPDPTFPTIVITGTNIMGDIKVRGPKKDSGWRKALKG